MHHVSCMAAFEVAGTVPMLFVGDIKLSCLFRIQAEIWLIYTEFSTLISNAQSASVELWQRKLMSIWFLTVILYRQDWWHDHAHHWLNRRPGVLFDAWWHDLLRNSAQVQAKSARTIYKASVHSYWCSDGRNGIRKLIYRQLLHQPEFPIQLLM